MKTLLKDKSSDSESLEVLHRLVQVFPCRKSFGWRLCGRPLVALFGEWPDFSDFWDFGELLFLLSELGFRLFSFV